MDSDRDLPNKEIVDTWVTTTTGNTSKGLRKSVRKVHEGNLGGTELKRRRLTENGKSRPKRESG